MTRNLSLCNRIENRYLKLPCRERSGKMPIDLQLEIAFRLSLAFAVGGLVGFERTHQQKPAGSRTHALVCLAAALYMIISIYGFMGFTGPKDPARIAAQVVTGIGFIGAGTIWKEGSWVRGLTTATTLWIISAIGLAIGVGLYVPSLVATALVYLGLQLHTVKKILTGQDEWADQLQMVEQLDLGNLKIGLEKIFAVPIKILTFNGHDPYVISFQFIKTTPDPFTLTISIKERQLTIVLIYIPEEMRFKGFGTRTVELLKQWAFQNNFQQINLTTKPNIQKIWINCGFKQVGENLYSYRLRTY